MNDNYLMTCINCGGDMIGDGYTEQYRCEFYEGELEEPDGDLLYCEFDEDEN